MCYRLISFPEKLDAEAELPASKSISNRVLVIRQLCEANFDIENLSDARDTILLNNLLGSRETTLDALDAGTTFRFLLVLLATQPGREVVLTGTKRMQERPVGPLVEALKDLGADINYQNVPGFPPLKIKGSKLQGGYVELDASVSSQFLSALLLIAPTLPRGLEIKLTKKPVSFSYVTLTTQLMNYYGVQCEWKGNSRIIVQHQAYQPRDISIESDWSSASYWYGITSLTYSGKARFRGLNKRSPQGDRIISSYMNNFGVQTRFKSSYTEISKSGRAKPYFVANMINTPDLIPTMAVLCSCFNISLHIKGTETLKDKESDRIQVLKSQLGLLGYHIYEENKNKIKGIPSQVPVREKVTLDPHNDHRMAMCFAMQACINSNIRIKQPELVEKSFPGFWESLRNNGIIFK